MIVYNLEWLKERDFLKNCTLEVKDKSVLVSMKRIMETLLRLRRKIYGEFRYLLGS